MGKIEFKSQVYTREQSERLLALGLKRETADMYHDLSTGIIEVPYTEVELQRELERNDVIPVWSLYRLMEIAMKGDKLGCITYNIHQNNVTTCYELVISSIEHLIKIDEFNKDYLEGK